MSNRKPLARPTQTSPELDRIMGLTPDRKAAAESALKAAKPLPKPAVPGKVDLSRLSHVPRGWPERGVDAADPALAGYYQEGDNDHVKK